MPRANVGTLLENIVLVEVAKSLINNMTNSSIIEFVNSFAMPPLSEWRAKRSDYGLDATALDRVSILRNLDIDYPSLMSACTRYDSKLGPNGALLVNMILCISNRDGRFWLNDAPDEEMRYTNEPFCLSELNAATAAVLPSKSSLSEIVSCQQFFPESMKDLESQLDIWRKQPAVARIGYLDPDMYSTTGVVSDSPHTDSESVRRFLQLLREGFDGPIASVHFTAHQMKEALDEQVNGLKIDGQATDFEVCVCRHGRFAVVVHHRKCMHDLAMGIRDAWNNWSSVALNRSNSYELEINQ